MKLKHITFTGIDDRTDIAALQDIQRRYPYVEFGVLLSWSRQGSERRYPSFRTIRIQKVRKVLEACEPLIQKLRP